jgi:hypothetical protein
VENPKYKNWIEDGIIFNPIVPVNQGLIPIAKAFEKNRDRVLRLGDLPFHLVSVSIAKTHVTMIAMDEFKQKKKTPENFDKRITKLTEEAMNGPASLSSPLNRLS